ncbi:hypothetical protein BDU57DRAFT_508687 [Ampelomyces quisqualis]|uniref:Uncharacterized protein n=1 Tax=Ampelomyces quisqualis TaxID=50730 RepID=A0A6A5QX84_AMPQU|nr:hypothetical protein BDU57DRAFT_508687 [Ampelomyces quisqualis]
MPPANLLALRRRVRMRSENRVYGRCLHCTWYCMTITRALTRKCRSRHPLCMIDTACGSTDPALRPSCCLSTASFGSLGHPQGPYIPILHKLAKVCVSHAVLSNIRDHKTCLSLHVSFQELLRKPGESMNPSGTCSSASRCNNCPLQTRVQLVL